MRLTRIDFTPEELTYLIRAARGMAFRLKQEAEGHKGSSSYEGQLKEARRFTEIADRLEKL